MFKKGLFWLLIGAYAVGRFLFPPLEFTGDSYGYACEILKGDLWNYHHLLHKYFLNDIWLITQPILSNIDPLWFFSCIHLLVALGSVFTLMRILEHRHWSESRIFLALIFVLSGFAFSKYSIENEVYFFPILLSLIGSWEFEKTRPFRAAIYLGIATLFHQIHIFWLIGLLFPRNWKKPSEYYPIVIGLFVPALTYSVLSLFTGMSLYSLLFQDVESGLVQVVPNIGNTLLFVVNIIRTFFQVHGDILLFWNLWNPYYSGLALLIFIFVLLGLLIYLRERRLSYKRSDWYLVYVRAFLLQMAFAWYSVGNIEFMVVLPILFVLTLRNGSLLKHSLLLSIGIIVWNTTQWYIPMAKTRPSRIQDQIAISHRIINDDRNVGWCGVQPPILVYTKNAATVQNAYEYDYLLDSLKGDELMDTAQMKANGVFIHKLKFVPFEGGKLNFGYWLSFTHGRINRSTLNYDTSANLPEQPHVKFTRLYRDTGMGGVLEFYRISPLNKP